MYEFSTKLDTEKRGYDGLARITCAAEEAQLIRSNMPHPPDSRSIFSLQKNGTDAERYAEHRADSCAVVRAVVGAERFADARAELRADAVVQNNLQRQRQPQRGDLFIDEVAFSFL